MRSYALRLLLYAFIGILSGCMIGPDFQKQSASVPERWAQPTPAATEGELKLIKWWEIFNDPTLSSLIERAAAGNLDLQTAQARIRQARAARDGAVAKTGPSVQTTATFSRQQSRGAVLEDNTVDPVSSNPQAQSVLTDLYQTGFDAHWELDFFGGVRRGIEAGEADLEVATEARRDTLVTITAEVARSYIELRILQKRIAIAHKHHKTQIHGVALTRRQLQGGIASALDVANAEAQASDTAARIPVLEATARQVVHKLGILLGGNPDMLVTELVPGVDLPLQPATVPAGVPSDLLRRRPDIRQAEAEIHAATARIGVAAADLFPRFTLSGSVSYLASTFSSLYTPANLLWSFGPAASWNLFDTGQARAQVAIREALQDQAVIQYRQTVLNALAEVENALIASAKEEEHCQALETSVRSNRKAVGLAERLYAGGETDFLHVLIRERVLYDAEDAFVQSTGASLIYQIALFKALGGGWESPPKG